MTAISSSSTGDLGSILSEMDKIGAASSCDYLAQRFVETFYTRFKESVVLARVFVTVPFGKLPPFNRQAVNSLATSAGIGGLIKDQTPVLSLVGTVGANPAWNDRKRSQGHVGIPLASGHFVESVPMMSRLLKQLGMELEWIDQWDTKIVLEGRLSGFAGTFYVADAAREVDAHGRKIIAAQDFVAKNGVKTVFGFGGSYIGVAAFAVLVVFTRETIDKKVVEGLQSLITKFKGLTMRLVSAGNIFSA